MSDDNARGSGRTTRQLQEIGARPAIYVVHSHSVFLHANYLLREMAARDGLDREIEVRALLKPRHVLNLAGESRRIEVDHAFWEARGGTPVAEELRKLLGERERPCGPRIELSAGFHAEPGATPGHQHDVYATRGIPKGMERLHVGNLTKAAVEAWAAAQKRS